MMSVHSIRSGGAGSIKAGPLYAGLFVLIAVLLALVAFSGALRELVRRWIAQEEYSHGFFIPLVSIWLLWSRREALLGSVGRPAWVGLGLLALAGAMHVVGEVSAFFLFSQVGFVVALMGIVLCAGGYSLLRVAFIPIIFLLFAIPTPYFLDSVLSWRLQLISSALGVYVIRLFDIPVHLAGNVIDLGNYKLQVVDACSGLRYLYPLASLGFLAAYLFQAPLWKRAIVFVSTVPITIAMNSFRIGMIGVLVDRWGTQMADGALHFFEGWIIFLACAGLLALEIYLLRLGTGQSMFSVFYLPKIAPVAPPGADNGSDRRTPLTAGLVLMCAITAAVFFISSRAEIQPERTRFVEFPKTLGQWSGRVSLLDPQIEHVLGLDDYILADYRAPSGRSVNFYAAYYASQRKGSSPHSPIVCIPGGGWQITKLERTSFRNDATGVTIPVNRVIIARENDKQLVYYWFVQRGRNIANEYWSKWYLLVDAITQNRTDGALVRVTTPFYATESEREADARVHSFLRDLEPNLKAYLPPALGTGPKSAQMRLHKS
jgi:exosortase D (VPLPA-CTERM-specific)